MTGETGMTGTTDKTCVTSMTCVTCMTGATGMTGLMQYLDNNVHPPVRESRKKRTSLCPVTERPPVMLTLHDDSRTVPELTYPFFFALLIGLTQAKETCNVSCRQQTSHRLNVG